MISLEPPPAADDEALLATLCKDPVLAAHHSAWLQAYREYRRRRGNGFALKGASFPPPVRTRQKKLYENRRDNSIFRDLRQQRLKGCSRCGSPGTGHLDHHLPESDFPEFAVLMANLVPTCGHCNSGAKLAKGTGTVWPQRFIHPYFDGFATKPLWRAIVIDPVALEFSAQPEPTLQSRLASLVEYNLANTLGWQFQNYLVNFWKSLPVLVLRQARGAPPGDTVLDHVLEDQAFAAETTEGVNGWRSALLRGLKADPVARQHLLSAAHALSLAGT